MYRQNWHLPRVHPELIRPLAHTRRWGMALAVAVCLIGHPIALAAKVAQQEPESATVRWWQPVLVLGEVAVLMLLDEPIARFVQDNRSTTLDDVAAGVRQMGQPEVYLTVAGGTLALGLITGDSRVTRAGGRLAATLALTGGLTRLGKFVIGRDRPLERMEDAFFFDPFSGGSRAFPSGHTSMAFAMATSLSEEIRRPWATAALYTGAGLVAWSRMNDNKHWLSDVVGGAMLGVFTAKVVNGSWRIFNIRPPGVAATSSGMSLAWKVEF
ncbi:MAG: phosphatase PAP2 family protein [Gemmatimonadales bacterium]|nr:phosphatase PAP2 family protein [Gemmatimonadales bacterium]